MPAGEAGAVVRTVSGKKQQLKPALKRAGAARHRFTWGTKLACVELMNQGKTPSEVFIHLRARKISVSLDLLRRWANGRPQEIASHGVKVFIDPNRSTLSIGGFETLKVC